MNTTAGCGAGPLRVVYIAGAQHCGSTMLDAILGTAPGARSLGEVGGFHRYSGGAACDCRRDPATCEVCVQVVGALAASGELPRFERLARLPLKERRPHWVLAGTPRRREYAKLADDLFAVAASATGASALIDSSKNACRAGALAHDSRHDVRVIHLVRDGRAYLDSKRRRATAEGRRLVPPAALAAWLIKNLLLWSVLRQRLSPDRYLLCRYEDLVADPHAELARIGRFAGLDTSALASAATGPGVDRRHLFEPRRRVDYRHVRLDPTRSRSTGASGQHLLYWAAGGFVSARWGYRRRAPLDGRASPSVPAVGRGAQEASP